MLFIIGRSAHECVLETFIKRGAEFDKSILLQLYSDEEGEEEEEPNSLYI